MKNRKISLRMLFAGAAIVAILGFGASQVVATNLDVPGTQQSGCTATACKKACPEFGGELRGSGKTWVCYCCG